MNHTPASTQPQPQLTVFYDGACPSCVRDRRNYERLAGRRASEVSWYDITGHEQQLLDQGIDPRRALEELHVEVAGRIVSELDAYVLLMQRVTCLRPLVWLLGWPSLRSFFSRRYRRMVERRLRREGRW